MSICLVFQLLLIKYSRVGSQLSDHVDATPPGSTASISDNLHALPVQGLPHTEQGSTNRNHTSHSANASSDIWSAAYREAIVSLGEDIDIAILMGDNTV